MRSWPTATLDDLFVIARGGSPRPIDSYIMSDPSGVNWVLIGDATEGSKYIRATKRRISLEGAKRSRAVKPGDFLLTNSMSFGKPYIMGTTGCVHDGWLVLSPRDDDVDPDFFYYLLGSDRLYSEFERRAAGATVKNLNIDVVRGVKVPLPPRAEQRRIAKILDKADALRAKRRAAEAQVASLHRAIFLEMFGNPRLNSRRWPVIRLGELGELDRGVSKHRLRNAPELLGGPHPLVQTGDIANSNGYVRQFAATYSDAGLRQSKMWPAGTLCITIAANIGKTGILTFEARFPDSVVGFAAAEPSIVEYVRVWLSFLQKHLEDSAPESAQKNINLQVLRNLPVPFPPVDLRQRFARRIEVTNQLENRQQQALAQFDVLFASLQSRAFSGQL